MNHYQFLYLPGKLIFNAAMSEAAMKELYYLDKNLDKLCITEQFIQLVYNKTSNVTVILVHWFSSFINVYVESVMIASYKYS